MSKGSPASRRKASRNYYLRNRDAIRTARNAAARANPPKKDRTTVQERARNRLRWAVWAGKIIKPTICDHCDKPGKIHGHHHDYSKPLDVQWLCTTCHGLAHSRI